MRVGAMALRVVFHTVRAFATDLLSLRAAGLTLVTLLALVPLFALVTGIGKGLGYGELLDAKLLQVLSKAPDVLQPAIEEIRFVVQRTSFAALGVIGTAVLAYSGLMLFVRVEQAFNRSWRVPHGRSWYRRLTDFVALIVLVPLLALAAVSLYSLLHGASWFHELPWLNGLYQAGIGFVPHVLGWMAFTALYRLMPAARVRWSSAAIGGVVAGSGWLFFHGLYMSTQLSVARINAIYATLAALPLLLIYLEVTWTMLLVGAEVSYAVQNRFYLTGPMNLPPPSQAVRRRLSLLIAGRVCADFAEGREGEDFNDLAIALNVPIEWVTGVYDDLHEAKLLACLDGIPGRIVPLRSTDQIRVLDVVEAIDGEIPARVRPHLRLPAGLEDRLARIDEATREVLANDLMRESATPRSHTAANDSRSGHS